MSGAAGFSAEGFGAAAFDAIVLAGGRGSRLGGVDKALLELAEQPLVERVVAAARAAGAARVIAVGPDGSGRLADRTVREDPPFSGPLAAVAAGLAEASAEWVLLLACDLVRPAEVIGQLTGGLGGPVSLQDPAEPPQAVILVDADGHSQWLCARVRADALRSGLERATREHGSLDGLPLRAVLGGLRAERLRAGDGSTADIDTPEQLALAREYANDQGKAHS